MIQKKVFLSKWLSCCLIISFLLSLMTVSVVLGAQAASYEPTNVIVTGGSTTIYVSWRNPDVDTITKVSLYDNETGELISEDFSKEKDAVCFQKFTVAEWGKKKCKLVFEFSDHDAINMILEGYAWYWNDQTTSHKINVPFTDWSLEYSASGDRAIPFKITADSSLGGNTGYSLHIASNSSSSTAVKIRSGVKLKAGKYNVQYKKKWNKVASEGAIKLMLGNEGINHQKTISYAGEPGENLNVSYTAEVTAAYSGNIFFEITGGLIEDFWIDDLEIYAADSNGTSIGNNLVLNGSFDSLKAGIPANLSNVAVQVADGGAVLSWTKPSDIDYINVYEKNSVGILNLRAIVRDDSTSVKLSGLENGKEYTYVLKAVNQYRMESEGEEVSIIPTKFTYYANNEKIYTLTSGDVTAKVTVENEDTNSLPAVLILALYDDGVLKEVKNTPVKIVSNTFEELSVTVNVPDLSSGDYILKAFLWDSLEGNLVPYVPANELAE